MRKLLAIVALLAVLFAVSPCAWAADPHGYIPGRFIVKLTDAARIGQLRQSLGNDLVVAPLIPGSAQAALSITVDWSRYILIQSVDSALTASQIRNRLGDSNIQYIEQDQYLDFYDYPTDPQFAHQWYLNNSGQEYWGIRRTDGDFNDSLVLKSGIAGNDINITPFYETPPADSHAVVVGVIDTGTDPLHPELAGRLWRNPDEIAANGVDDDHNGYVDDTIGYDVSGDTPSFFDIQGDNDITDYHGHGTHIAGIVAANADGQGVVGIAPWSRILSVKIRPNAFLSIGTAGVLYAINNGARVLNISWGTPFEALILEDALRFARANGVFVAIAAGNSGDGTRGKPAAVDSAFTVAAGDSRGFMAWFSTRGPFVEIVAPGVDILSLRATGTDMYTEANEPGVRIVDSLYYLSDGTSMAAPIVAGAAALIWSFKPQLSVGALETALKLGADDMVDPLDQGDTLTGVDTVSGYGYLNLQRSFEMAISGGLVFVAPMPQQRYTGPIQLRAAAINGYLGDWVLEYSVGPLSENWQSLAAGTDVPPDSVLFVFDRPDLNGIINFRLTDEFSNAVTLRVTYVNEDRLELATPRNFDTLRYSIPIVGSAFGVTYDSVVVSYRFGTGAESHLLTSTREYFDTLLTTWNASGVASGTYTIFARGYFDSGVTTDTAAIFIASSFAAGWPRTLPSKGPQSIIAADLDHDGFLEIIAGSSYGLFAYNYLGQVLDGFPVLPEKDVRCLPAIYDVDADGDDEIIVTSDDGIYIFNLDGSSVAGWPRLTDMGPATLFGYPTPSVIELAAGAPPTIMCINGYGELLAFRLNGESHFYSLGGHYSYFNPYLIHTYFFAGNSVTSADLNGDHQVEALASYTGLYPRSGVAVFDARTARPAFGAPGPHVIANELLYGMVLADLTGDDLPEIIATGQDSVYGRTLYVKTRAADGSGLVDLAGWPRKFPELPGWIGNFPTVADLNLDGTPEILCTFYEFDVASLYIFQADGTPYLTIDGRPEGEVFNAPVTLSNPIVANVTGDRFPEIAIRAGYILPTTGHEQFFLLDHTGTLLPGFPITTPANVRTVISTTFSPLIQDIDNDGLVEVALPGDNGDIYVWDFDAPSDSGKNVGRILMDNRNRNIYTGPSVPTDVPDDHDSRPLTWSLAQNYPNPFNPSTTIEFTLPRRAHVTVEIFNILGQKVATPLNKELPAGRHEVDIDGRNLASGIYLYRLSAESFTATRKMVLLK